MSATAPLRLLAYTDAEGIGGAELVLGHLLAALGPHVRAGVLGTDFAVASAIAARRPDTPARAVRRPEGAGDILALREHARAVRAFAPDVLHGNHSWPWACAYGELAGLLVPGVRVVGVDHLPVDADVPRLRRLTRRLIASRLDARVAVGERAARRVEELVGLRSGSVTTVLNGVPPPDPATGLRLASGPIVGAVGRLTAQKGFDALVRVLPALDGATLVLVGDGPERGVLERLASDLGVRERLLITGWTAQAREHLAGFDVYALPSQWEGLPLVVLEAMHAGLPVVAYDVGSVAEAVRDGETGFVVASGDERALRERLMCLLADADERRRLGAHARTLAAQHFTAAEMARGYERLYERALGRASRSSRSTHRG